MTDISIIVPIYNVEKYLRQCLDSLVNQTLKNIEIICINDGSSDNSEIVLNEYAEKDSRIKIINQKNTGAAAARNAGIYIAIGEYIGFCDPDDYIDLDYYENLYIAAKCNNADIAKGLGKTVFLNGEISSLGSDLDSIQLNRANFNTAFTTAIYKREFLNQNKIDFPNKLVVGEDCVFLAKAVLMANKIELVKDKSYYFYIRRDNSLDSDKLDERKIKSNIETTHQIIDFMNVVELDEVTYNIFSTFLIKVLISILKRTDSISMQRLIIKSLIELWSKCKFKYEYAFMNPNAADALEKHDNVKLFNMLIKKNKTYKLFGFPLLKIRYRKTKTIYRLFAIIPIFVKNHQLKSVKLFFYNDEFNFGDLLNIDISCKIFKTNIIKANEQDCAALFIGSLLQCFLSNKSFLERIKSLLLPRMKIWGAGFIVPEKSKTEELVRRIDVYAVRGILTFNRLQKIKSKKLKNVAIGDPGLLASKLIDTSKIQKKYSLGIIPHYVDKDNPLLNKIKIENSVVIDIQQSPEIFLAQIAKCENVIASAMHGLIAADSLGIPNLRMVLSDKIVGGDYKYNDYYSAFGLDSHPKIDLRDIDIFNDLKFIKKNYKVTQAAVKKIQQDLIDSFPYAKVG